MLLVRLLETHVEDAAVGVAPVAVGEDAVAVAVQDEVTAAMEARMMTLTAVVGLLLPQEDVVGAVHEHALQHQLLEVALLRLPRRRRRRRHPLLHRSRSTMMTMKITGLPSTTSTHSQHPLRRSHQA